MDKFFSPSDPIYFGLAAAIVAIHLFYMPRRPTLQQRALLHLPGAFLHELAHALVAALLGGKPKMHVTPRPDSEGLVLGETSWGPISSGYLGNTLIGFAPVLCWIPVWYISGSQLAEPQSLIAGLGWLVACLICMDAALMVSLSDMRHMGIPFLFTYIMVWAVVIVDAFVLRVPAAICSNFDLLCWQLP